MDRPQKNEKNETSPGSEGFTTMKRNWTSIFNWNASAHAHCSFLPLESYLLPLESYLLQLLTLQIMQYFILVFLKGLLFYSFHGFEM